MARCRWRARSVQGLVLAAALAVASPPLAVARAAEPALVAQLVKLHKVSGTVFSPDGGRAVFVVAEPAVGKDRKSSIWLYESATQTTRKLTAAGKQDSQPRWSSDGKTLAFISSRGDDEPQVYLLPMDGGEAQPLTTAKGGVSAFEWSPAGGMIAYVGSDPEPESPEKENGDDVGV